MTSPPPLQKFLDAFKKRAWLLKPLSPLARLDLRVWALVLILCCGVSGVLFWFLRRPANVLFIEPLRAEFYHDQFLEWTLRAQPAALDWKLRKMKFNTWLERSGERVVSVGDIRETVLRYDKKAGLWRARIPCPWNAPAGDYAIRVDTSALPVESLRLRARPLRVADRAFKPLPPGFGVLTLESIGPLRKLLAPDGTRKDGTALAEWAEFIGADAVVIQGAESGGYGKKLPAEFPWITQSKAAIKTVARECHKRGLKFGVYVMSYMVGGTPDKSPDYDYGWIYEDGRMINGLEMRKRRGVSITDPRRIKDIINVARPWYDMEEVDIVGLDYIRPVFGGYELVDAFVRDMPVTPPADWDKRSLQQRMTWLFTHRSAGGHNFIEQWYWYRAHRTAQVVRAIKAGLGDKKPLWAFTLSWEKGWHHGQDPVMMRDAGIDIDAIMAYEADSRQFQGFVKQWREYVRRKEVNLLVGDAVDWVLHQRTLNPAGPEDFYNRDILAVSQFHADGPVRGVFVHDYVRATRGRLGPYSTLEWFLAGGAIITTTRRLNGALGYDLTLSLPDRAAAGETVTGKLTLGRKRPAGTIRAHLYSAADVSMPDRDFELSPSTPAVAFTFRWVPDHTSAPRGHRSFVAVRAERTAPSAERCQIHIMYFQGQRGNKTPEKPAPKNEGATENRDETKPK